MIIKDKKLEAVPDRLAALGYPHADSEVARALLIGTLKGIDIRIALEAFFAHSTRMAGPIRFVGDESQWKETWQFARDRGWLTETEHRFVRSLYGLLSDAVAHDGASLIDELAARVNVLATMWLVLHRQANQQRSEKRIQDGAAGKLQLARQFLAGIRREVYSGPAFERWFDLDLIHLTRQVVRSSDAPHLMRTIMDEKASPGIRSDCASIVLSPRCITSDNLAALDLYCERNSGKLPWEVERAIALAIENRAHAADRLISYLRRISSSGDLLNKNLDQSEKYYSSREAATAYYLSCLSNRRIPAGGCTWPAFYLSYRADHEDWKKRVKPAFKRRIEETTDAAVSEFWTQLVERRMGG
ncbi:MAG: hypothetical protein JSR45_18550 [Proteobacteria bacterium]|nr:hypothetical protein [Pseudomonadota bacterium]